MSKRPYHRRFHSDAISGYMGLTLEERGAYSTLLDYLYDRGEPLPGNMRLIAGYLDVSVRKAETVVQSLVAKDKLQRLPDGRLTNRRFEKEVENDAKTSRDKAEIGSAGGRKSAETRKTGNKNNATGQAPAQAEVKLTTSTSISTTREDSSVPSLRSGTGAQAHRGELFETPVVPEAKPAKPKPPADDPKKRLYDRGKEIFGPEAGGIITNVLKAKENKIGKALALIEDAAEKRDPVAWINGWLWNHGPPGLEVGRMESAP